MPKKCSYYRIMQNLFLPLLILYFLVILKLSQVKTEKSDSKESKSGESTEVGPEILDSWWELVSTSQPKYEETTKVLRAMESSYPENIKMYSVGKTVEGREMWVVHLGKGIGKGRTLLKPQVKIVANMHGDETLGRALLLMLAVDSLRNKDQSNFLDLVELHLMPSVNPDGYEAVETDGECNPDPDKSGRRTANLVDLNRDFPDQFDTERKPDKERNPETRNMIKWIKNSYFVLSANLHALTMVASYPFDSVPPEVEFDPSYTGDGVISKTPDDETFYYLANLYAKTHKLMGVRNNCTKKEKFHKGVTNGAEWYNVKGGMQDYNYLHSNTFEVTLELSCCKNVPSSSLLWEWDNNREALRQYILSANMGIKGLVKDEQGKPIKGAMIRVEGIDHNVTTTPQGEYWRLLLPGTYRLWAEATDFKPSNKLKAVVFNYDTATRLDFKLTRNADEED